jgi:hypothetical protein
MEKVMGKQLSPSLVRESGIELERTRSLPVPGRFHGKVGDLVAGDQVIAEAELAGDLLMLRLPERMGLQPNEVVQGLLVKEGSEVKIGDLLCQHSGLFGLMRTTFTAPESGIIELVSQQTGHIGLRLASKQLSMKAYVSGVIKSLDGDRAITIKTQGTFVQGIFGVGGERFGVLQFLDIKHHEAITEASIPESCLGSILVGGTAPTIAAIRLACKRGAVGLVTGSIDDNTLQQYLGYDLGLALTGDEDVPMTIIVTEGFGNMSFSSRVAELLALHNGMQASINGATQVRAGAMRPEIIVQTAQISKLSEVSKALDIGVTVRVTRNPYFGELAQVIELPNEPEIIASGAKTRVAVVVLSNGDRVKVPRANVEL